jgi:hypothetical protein
VALVLDGLDFGGLQALGSLFYRKLDALAFFQVAISIALDSGEVHEDIWAAFAGDETVALASIEPFNRTDDTFRHFCLLAKEKRVDVVQYVFGSSNKKRLKTML